MVTEEEKILLDKTTDLWNGFLKLPVEHPTEKQEFMHHLHIIQNILLSRSAYRELTQTKLQE